MMTNDAFGMVVAEGDEVFFKVDRINGSINLDDRAVSFSCEGPRYILYRGVVQRIRPGGHLDILVGRGLLSGWANSLPPEKVKKVDVVLD